jgi:ABC-type bacteriocin/lantibiotic exporters, contain an N-terminal double-glycine peptidase domain
LNHANLAEFLGSVEIFSVLRKDELEELAANAELQRYNFGDAVLNAGDPGKGLYVIKSGTVRIFTEEQGKQITMGIRKEREVFAEVAAIREYQHEYSVRASSKTELLFIPRQVITRILDRNQEAKSFVTNYATINTAGGFVTKLFDLRRKLDQSELEDVIRSVGIKRAQAGQVILEQGSVTDRRLYVVRAGKVRIVNTDEGNEYQTATVGRGDVFGEKACLMRQPQAASAIAETDVVLLVIPEKTVHFIIEHNPKLKEVLEERIEFFERELLRQKKLAERRRRRVLLDLRSRPGLGERILKRFPLVEQAEEMDCGAACLAMICKHYGIPMMLGKLRELANVTTEGATLESLARVGESLGFTTRGVRATYQAVLGFELPFIAHWEGYHYVVVYGVSKDHVWVADPALGFKKMMVAEFEKGWNGTCLLFAPGTEMVQIAAQRSPWVRFIGYLKPYKNILGHLVIATLVIDALGVAPPIIVQNVLDRVVVQHDVELLNLLIVGLVLSHFFTQLTAVLRAFLANFMVRSLDFTMIAQFFKHTLSLPIAFFAKRKTGEIFARFQENVTVRNFLTESTISTVLNVLMVFIYLIVLFLYNVKLTLLLLALVIPMGILTVVATPMIKNYARRDFEASTAAESFLMETLSGAETIKATAIERPMRLKWERQYAKALDVRYRATIFNALMGLVSHLLSATTSIVILWVGANLVLSQELTIGQLIAFNMLMGSVMSPLLGLIGLWNELQGVGVAMERLGDVLELEPEQKPEDLSSRIALPDLRGEIRFENVFFRYGGTETPYVLENIGFDIKTGEVVAIVGQSGSGKTTLAKLLVGFYPPTEGKIYVDGYELNLLDKEYYRAQIGYVMQNNLLFSGTIAENIALGDENPDRRRIVEAAKMADAHGFISNMPLKYEQVVGERGVGLSGGQMQRLCIARALYRDPRLLILDEATSSLDAQSESNILKNMEEVLKGRTAVVIAHRLSTVMNASKILVLYAGRIVEEGPHEELLEKKGMYYQLVQKQIAGMR